MLKTCVALDITSSNIRVVSIENGKITKWHSEPLPEGLFKGGTISEQQAVSIILDNLFKTQNLKRNQVICCVTGLPFTYRIINMPGSAKEVPEEAIERAARKELSLPEEDMYLAWQAIEEHTDKKETDYFVVGVPKTSLNPVINTLSLARINPLSLDLKPLALARLVSQPNALIISAEKSYFDIIVVAGGYVRVVHSFGSSIGFDDIQATATELIDGLNKAVKSFYREFSQNSFPMDSPILLSGEIASEEILPLIQAGTGHPTSFLKPQLDIPPDLSTRLYGTNLGLFLKNQGSATDKNQFKDININLLSGLHKKTRREFKLINVLAIALFAVLLIGFYTSYDFKSQTETRIVTLREQSKETTKKLAAAQQANKAALNDRQANLQRLQIVTEQLNAEKSEGNLVTGLKRDYAHRIEFILSKMTDGVEYTSLSMQPSTIQVNGKVPYPASQNGEKRNPIGEVDFAQKVGQNDIFSSAKVVSIVPAGDSDKAEFTVIIKE
jgi:hypothetical protein